jgi:hypothetical protein
MDVLGGRRTRLALLASLLAGLVIALLTAHTSRARGREVSRPHGRR